MERVKVTTKGQLTLPKALREELRIEEGDYLEVHIRGNELILKPIPKKPGKEMLIEYCRANSEKRLSLGETQRLLSKVGFSLSEQVRRLRDKG